MRQEVQKVIKFGKVCASDTNKKKCNQTTWITLGQQKCKENNSIANL